VIVEPDVLNALETNQLSLLLWAHAKIGIMHPTLYHVLSGEALNRWCYDVDSWSQNRTDPSEEDGELLDESEHGIPGASKNRTDGREVPQVAQIVSVAWALATTRTHAPDTFAGMARVAHPLLEGFSPEEMTGLDWSFSYALTLTLTLTLIGGDDGSCLVIQLRKRS